MKDFNSYENPQQNNQSTSGQSPFDMLKDLASKYEGASENELLAAILSEAKTRKQAGTLTNEDIDVFIKTISPMLTPAQKAKLNAIIKSIK